MKRLAAVLVLALLASHLCLPLATTFGDEPHTACGCAPGACLCALAEAMTGEHCHGGGDGLQLDRCDRTPDEETVAIPPLDKASPAPVSAAVSSAPGRLAALAVPSSLDPPAAVDPRPPRRS
ncbi:MAG TPA: hypothetical protein VKU40_14420 [Thermoanaerobaculia bacterium]|nr:hypothetical protein [Thermoanaerobaculia bacterium]